MPPKEDRRRIHFLFLLSMSRATQALIPKGNTGKVFKIFSGKFRRRFAKENTFTNNSAVENSEHSLQL